MDYRVLDPLVGQMDNVTRHIAMFPDAQLLIDEYHRYGTDMTEYNLDMLVVWSQAHIPTLDNLMYQNRYFFVGADHRRTVAEGLSGLPSSMQPMCPRGLYQLYKSKSKEVTEAKFYNMMHTVVDGKGRLAGSRQKLVEESVRNYDGTVLVSAFNNSFWKWRQPYNYYLIFTVNLLADEGAIFLGTEVVRLPDKTKVELYERWTAGAHCKYSKSLPLTPKMFDKMGECMRRLLGTNGKTTGTTKQKQLATTASLAIADVRLKYLHPFPEGDVRGGNDKNPGNVVWPLLGETYKYLDDTFAAHLGRYCGDMEVVSLKGVRPQTMEALEMMAKENVPVLPKIGHKFCGKEMQPYTPAVPTWLAVCFGQGVARNNRMKGWDPTPDSDAYEIEHRNGLFQMSEGYTRKDATGEHNKKAVGGDLARWAAHFAFERVKLYNLMFGKEKADDKYRVKILCSYEQGRISTDAGVTTVPHQKVPPLMAEKLLQEGNVHITNIDIALDEFGFFTRFFRDGEDHLGKLVHVTHGNAICYPAALAQEVGFITHIGGNRKLCLQVMVIPLDCFDNDAIMEAVHDWEVMDPAALRVYPHIPHTVSDLKEKQADSYESGLRLVKVRSDKKTPTNFKSHTCVYAFDRLKRGHDWEALYDTFA